MRNEVACMLGQSRNIYNNGHGNLYMKRLEKRGALQLGKMNKSGYENRPTCRPWLLEYGGEYEKEILQIQLTKENTFTAIYEKGSYRLAKKIKVI